MRSSEWLYHARSPSVSYLLRREELRQTIIEYKMHQKLQNIMQSYQKPRQLRVDEFMEIFHRS